ncbi:MAG TPA: hypothetical protein VM433_12840 [Mycobacteriales bacterium]|nr:hypothetical protein [Mycobacteriales bacterium]
MRSATCAYTARTASACSARSGHDGQGAFEALDQLLRGGPALVRVGGAGREQLSEQRVHLGRRGAEPLRLRGEVATDLVGVQVGLGEQVPDAGGGHRPALGGRALEVLQHGEGRRLVAHPPLEPAEGRGHVRAAGVGERPRHLEVGVGAGLHATEQLEDVLVADDDRRVALLRAHDARRERGVELGGAGEGQP